MSDPVWEECYRGDEYLGTRTVVTVEPEDGPGGGRHRYDVGFEETGRPDIPTVCVPIRFQCGPVAEVGVNGIQDEGLLAVLIDRLLRFQAGPFACRENALALTKLEEAMHWMDARKRDRVRRGVEGRNKA